MVAVLLGAGDHPRLVEGREAHRLGLVELRVLERRQSNQRVAQRGREFGAVEIDAVGEYRVERVRKVGRVLESGSARRSCRPGLGGGFLVVRVGHADHGAGPFRLADHRLRLRGRDSFEAGEVGPLVGVGFELRVDEGAVAEFARFLLQRQGDQVAEAAIRQRVLVREQTIIGIEPHVRASPHGVGQHGGADFAGELGGKGFLEEQPQMGAVPRARAFDCRRQSQRLAGLARRRHVLGPVILVEIDGEEPALLVPQHGIHAHDKRFSLTVPPRQMLPHDLVGDRQKVLMAAGRAFDPGSFAHPAHPLVPAGRLVPRPPRPPTFEANRKHILPPPEQRPKQPNLRLRRGIPVDGWSGVRRSGVHFKLRVD